MNDQKTLLRIVRTWSLSPQPEYRGFRCANCQAYMKKAWYHWLDSGGYKTPVHFCSQCEKTFRSGKIETEKPIVKVDKSRFLKFPEEIKTWLARAVNSWKTKAKPIYKTFTCDECEGKMHKAYHVWDVQKGVLVEIHFCKKCGDKLKLASFRS